MDKYSQKNCRSNGMVLLKVMGCRLMQKRWGDSRWMELKCYPNGMDCYRAAIELCMRNCKYVKL